MDLTQLVNNIQHLESAYIYKTKNEVQKNIDIILYVLNLYLCIIHIKQEHLKRIIIMVTSREKNSIIYPNLSIFSQKLLTKI